MSVSRMQAIDCPECAGTGVHPNADRSPDDATECLVCDGLGYLEPPEDDRPRDAWDDGWDQYVASRPPSTEEVPF